MKRKTIRNSQTLQGVGIHTGETCSITFKPTTQGYISFIRTDIANSEPIIALAQNVSSTLRGTNIANKNAEVHTIEHVLSAANGLGITDLIIEMDGPEPPIMDGSSLPYAKAMLEGELAEIDEIAEVLHLNKEISFSEGDISYTAKPCEDFKITFVYERKGHPLVAHQEYTFTLTPEDYLREIAPARTFGFEEEIAYLQANGLAKGGNLENCVVIKKDGFSVPLRFDNEMVRHKILDLIGDLKLTGKVLGPMHITCHFGGHKTNVAFAKKLTEQI